jgi:hypothetical protein
LNQGVDSLCARHGKGANFSNGIRLFLLKVGRVILFLITQTGDFEAKRPEGFVDSRLDHRRSHGLDSVFLYPDFA